MLVKLGPRKMQNLLVCIEVLGTPLCLSRHENRIYLILLLERPDLFFININSYDRTHLHEVILPPIPSSTISNMYLSSFTLFGFASLLTSTSAAPSGFQTRQIPGEPPPPTKYGVHVQTPHDIAIIEGLGFHNKGDPGIQNASCNANDTECVTGQRPTPTVLEQQAVTPQPEPTTTSVAAAKRTRWTKRIPQGDMTGITDPNAAAAESFINSINSPPPSGSPANQTCVASDTNCVSAVLKRNPQELPESSAVEKAAAENAGIVNPGAVAAENFGTKPNVPIEAAPLNMSCTASDVNCVAKRDALRSRSLYSQAEAVGNK